MPSATVDMMEFGADKFSKQRHGLPRACYTVCPGPATQSVPVLRHGLTRAYDTFSPELATNSATHSLIERQIDVV